MPDNNIFIKKLLFSGRVPENNLLLSGTLPENNLLLSGRVPENNLLLSGRVPDNNFFLFFLFKSSEGQERKKTEKIKLCIFMRTPFIFYILAN